MLPGPRLLQRVRVLNWRRGAGPFTRCADCGRIYWPGSHYARMRAALGVLPGA